MSTTRSSARACSAGWDACSGRTERRRRPRPCSPRASRASSLRTRSRPPATGSFSRARSGSRANPPRHARSSKKRVAYSRGQAHRRSSRSHTCGCRVSTSSSSTAERSLETAEKAVEVATAAGADFERIWAQSWMAYSLLDVGRTAEGIELLDESFDEARSRGYSFIAHNIAYNEAWTRLHTMTAGHRRPNRRDRGRARAGSHHQHARDRKELGPPEREATSWEHSTSSSASSGPLPPQSARRCAGGGVSNSPKSCSSSGAFDDAAALIPPLSERAELQDIAYDAAAQIRLRLATGRVEEAIEIAREIAQDAPRFAPYWDAVAVAAEAFVAAELLDEAQAMVRSARSRQTDVGVAFLDEAEGRVLLAQGEVAEARKLLTAVAEQAAARGFRLVEWRARALAAEATAFTGGIRGGDHGGRRGESSPHQRRGPRCSKASRSRRSGVGGAVRLHRTAASPSSCSRVSGWSRCCSPTCAATRH